MALEIIRSQAADRLLACAAFRAQWTALHSKCPWATAFQSPEFAVAWYESYRQSAKPIFVISRNSTGEIDGLLALAMNPKSGKLTVAGAHQAEYQCWICEPQLAGVFAPAAFEALRRALPDSSLKFSYLPADVPLAWASDEDAAKLTLVTTHRRPLLRLRDGAEVRASLSKSGNKSRIRQLKKIGPVEFKRVTSPADFEPLLEEMARQHDARQLAVHGLAPFSEDALKQPFHRAMMRTPGLLHMTALMVGPHIVSAQLNVTRGRELQLYLISHNPLFARFSPGKLHILFLARMLAEDGYEALDLTPGGDAYKERFANDADEVHSLTVHPHAASKLLGVARGAGRDFSRLILNHFDSTPVAARETVRDLVTANPCSRLLGCLRRGLDWVASHVETRVYAFDLAGARFAGSLHVHRNSLEDLLAYRPAKGEPSRRQFISQAMKRLEEGHQVYTVVEDGRLLHAGWLVEQSAEETANEMLPGFGLPPGSGCVIDLRTFAAGRERGLATTVLEAMLNDASRGAALKRLYAAVPARNTVACRTFENAGFVYQCSSHMETKLGRSAKWISPSSTLIQMPDEPVRGRASSLPYHPPRAA